MGFPYYLFGDNFIKTRHITDDTPYEVREIAAVELLRPERLDLAAKLAYIDAKVTGESFEEAKKLYAKHIEAFSEGSFAEPGDEEKTSLDKYFGVFDALIADFQKNGFCAEKSLVPVGDNNVILDGAHRTACAIYFHQMITVAYFPGMSVKFDYDYFRSRYLSEQYLREMAATFVQFSNKQLYCCCMWPVADMRKRAEAVKKIAAYAPIVLDTEISLTKEEIRGLMIEIYGHQDWVGTADDGYAGVMGKVNACFRPGRSTRVVIFEGGDLQEVLDLKASMRGIFQIEKHSLHISDSNEETKQMIATLFASDHGADSSSGFHERMQDVKATLHWKKERSVLRVKQLAASTADKLGMYDALHRIHNRMRGQ